MKLHRQVTVFEGISVVACTVIGVGVLALPRFAAEAAGSGAPLVALTGTFLGLIGLCVITVLGMRFPNESIVTYSQRVVGKWVARLGTVCIICFFAILSALAAREFGEVVIASILPRTPIQVTILSMLLLSAIASRNEIATFVHIQTFYLPFIIVPSVVMIGLSMKNAHWIYIEPLLGNRTTLNGFLGGVLTIAALYQGTFIMTVLIPSMRQPEKAMKSSLWGLLVSGGLYLFITCVTVAVFGANETKLSLFPTLELAKFTMVPGEFLERLDGLFIIVWVVAVFTTIYSSYFLTVHAMTDLFAMHDQRFFSVFTMPFVFIMATLPRSVVDMYEVIKIVGRIGLIITIGYPMILLCVSWLRKMRGDGR
jgi:spore germination protein